MSAYNMKPQFKDIEGYRKWREEWKSLYMELSQRIREGKREIKNLARAGKLEEAARKQSELHWNRIMAFKSMDLLQDAKIRAKQIREMQKGIEEQNAQFPMTIEGAKNIDFHFNKKHLEFNFIPMWTLKAKGKSYYLNHIDCETSWTTRETPDNPSTKGSIRIRRGTIHIDSEGCARITAE